MAAIHVGVSQDNYFVIARLVCREFIVADAATDCRDQRLNLGVFQHLV